MNQIKKNISKHIWTILTVVFAVVATACVILMTVHLVQGRNAQKQNEELRENVVQEETVTENTDIVAVEPEAETEENQAEVEQAPEIIEQEETEWIAEYNVPDKDIDWTELSEINPHVYAWLTVPGTTVDYPVVQHPDELDYYLKHNIDGSSGYPGCIYSQILNSKEWDDPMTVLYGHNMRNGTMFASLHLFEDSKFFEENRYVYIYSENYVRVYEIFAAYEFSNAHLLMSFDTKNSENFSAYLGGVFEHDGLNDNINREIEVTAGDKILTLSTCITNKPDSRYLVQAVLVEEGTLE